MTHIRVLIGIMGLDQHEVGAIAVSRMLRDAGVEVIYAGRFNLPPKIVKTAIEEDVNVIGLSTHSWEYLDYVPELLAEMEKNEMNVPVVVGGSVITPGDAEKLLNMGVDAALGPNTSSQEIVSVIQRLAQPGP